jgi:hypothetical protein
VRLAAILVLAGSLLASTDVGAEGRARHTRLVTANGPVHVWTPRGYDPETAGIVLYVHGFYTTVDRAWREHRLAHQFAESGVNAIYIACEAPTRPGKRVSWTKLGELLAQVSEQLGTSLPTGRVAAVGHSGAYRTLSAWLDSEELDTVALVDALYGDVPRFHDWIEGSDDRRLIDVADLARRWTDALHARLPETVRYDGFPAADAGRLVGARQERIVYVPTTLGHMPLITGGVALPMILRALRLPTVASASREAPIRGL